MSQKALDVRQFNVHWCLDPFFTVRKLHELSNVSHVRHDRIFAQATLQRQVVVVALDGRIPIGGAW
jgi:hypothetical protein